MRFFVYFFLLINFFFINIAISSEGSSFISFGHVDLADSRLPLNIKDFVINKKLNSSKVKVSFIDEKIGWVRTSKNLLAPRARFQIKIFTKKNIYIKYLDKTIFPSKSKDFQHTELFTNLFNPEEITIFENGKILEILKTYSLPTKDNVETHLIDYSCVKYSLKITGLDNEYLSMGCKMDKTGPFGNERPRLEVSWITTNFHLKNETQSIYTVFITNNDPVKIILYNQNNKKTKVTIKAKVPRSLKRVKTALGFGPYTFKAVKNEKTNNSYLNPAAMIYAKYDISNNTSLRAFDALVMKDSFFNNFGLYYAYELATLMDGRISIIPLLGAQGLSYRFDNNYKMTHSFIYPQGVEINFRHVFGLENYHFVYGMFLSTSSEVDYENLWIRFGKKYFAELNYIRWGQDNMESKMIGLSIGLPFMTFL